MTNLAYVELETRYRRVALLGETSAILHWDTAAIMPDGAAIARAEQSAEMQAVIHGLKTASELGDLIGEAEAQAGELDDWQRANLSEMSRQWTKAGAVPEDLVVALSRACSACETAWRAARPAGLGGASRGTPADSAADGQHGRGRGRRRRRRRHRGVAL